MEITILIIEDEFTAGNYLKQLIIELYPNVKVLEIISSVEESVEWLTTNNEPDLIFMDIHLSDGLSFSIFESIDIKCPIIFVTAFDQYAIKAFEINSIGYILKPIDAEAIKKSVDKYFNNIANTTKNNPVDIKEILKIINSEKKQYKQNFLVQIKDKLITIDTNKIIYFYTEQKIARAVTENFVEYQLEFNIEEITNFINPISFFRVNRQFIINRNAINEVIVWFNGKLMIKINNNNNNNNNNNKINKIEVSKARVQEFKKWLGS